MNDAELALASWLAEEEAARQRAVVLCRNYFDGEQDSYLTGEQRAFLNIPSGQEFWLNVFRTVVDSVTERLVLDGATTVRAANADNGAPTPLADWATQLWQESNGALLSSTVHEGACRDGEFFVIVDYDTRSGRARLTPHQRYTDPSLNGDGFGCKAHYQDDDTDAPLLFVSKRWIEQLDDLNGWSGRARTRNRMTLYYPDRIEKYFHNGGDWVPFDGEEGGSIIPWVDGDGRPLGIPVVHFRNTNDLRPEAWDAIPLQRAINKNLLDLMGAADLTGFQMYAAFGWYATSDGQPPKADGSNALKLGAGQIFGTDRPARDASMQVIGSGDLRQLIDLMQSLIGWLAVVTSTPESRLSFTRQIAAEGTLQEQKEGLFAKVRKRQALFDDAWVRCFDMARRLANVFAGANLEEEIGFLMQWQPVQSRDTADERDEWKVKRETLKVPLEVLWGEAGYTPEQIAEMKNTEEYRSMIGMMQIGLGAEAG